MTALLVGHFSLACRQLELGPPVETLRVLPEDGVARDARLVRAVTLDDEHAWTTFEDLDAWGRRAERVRRQILVAAGLWPEPERCPLNPVVHGAVEREGYTVEKVFFQSWPGVYVTGNLYRPRGFAGPRPGVLCPHGHWDGGRFSERSDEEARAEVERGVEPTLAAARYHLQARCAQLARMGCVVLHYDMLGYADAVQLGHATGFEDAEAVLRLQSAFGVQTWNSVRALDFLASLRGVDPARIGVTGASGGGTQTFILGAIDDRPAVAFPAVMVSTAMQGGCVCENAPHLRVGSGNVEFAALFAPRPLALSGANDWTLEIETKGLPELKTLYAAYEVPGNVDAKCHPAFDHNYNAVSRAEMYAWFHRHLGLELSEPVVERDFVPLPPAELSVFDAAHPRPADAVDATGLRQRMTVESDRRMAALVPENAVDLAEFRSIVGGALEVLVHSSLPEPGGVASTVLVDGSKGGYRVLKLTLAGAPGEAVPAVLFLPGDWTGDVVVALSDRGKGAFFTPTAEPSADAEVILEHGAALLSIDAFLTGELLAESPPKDVAAIPAAFRVDDGRHGRYVGYTFGYNRTLLAQRVHDVLTAVAFARDFPGSRSVRLLAGGDAGTWAILARALAGDAVAKTVAEWRPSFDAVEALDDPNLLPGAKKYGGLAAFAALCAPGELILTAAPEVPDATLAAYRAAGAEQNVGCVEPDGSGILLEWIASP